jgi:molecular chaperone DnaJ
MPRYVRCGACDGTGHPLEMGVEPCPYCAGTGRDTKSDLWAEPCPHCNGSGQRTYCRRSFRSCPSCGGTGTLLVN